MKKLVAMLLALALVASLGVTSMFASADYTNAQSADLHQDNVNYIEDFKADITAKKASLTDINNFWKEYARERQMILMTVDPTLTADTEISSLTPQQLKDLKTLKQNDGTTYYAALTELDAWAKVSVKEMGIENKALGYLYVNGASIADLYDWTKWSANMGEAVAVLGTTDDLATVATEKSAEDALITSALEDELAENKLWQAYFAKKAAADKAAADLAEKIAAATKGMKTDTPANKLLFDATVAKVTADVALASAKDAADTAKKAIAVAQKGAYVDAQAALTQAQAIAYNNMAAEINTAVAEYVAGVYTAISDFYGSLS